MTEASPRGPDQPRRKTLLILVAVLFLGPLAIASFFYSGTSWRPVAGVAHGTLFDPVAKLPVVELRDFAGTSLAQDSLDGLWILIYLSHGPCEIECQKSLYDTRQVRVLLAEKDRRVRRLLIAGEPLPDPAYLSEYHPGLVTVTAASAGSDFIQAFGRDLNDKSDQDILRLDRVYIVDPLGNLVMAYESGFDAKDLLKDLKRLLRLSRIG